MRSSHATVSRVQADWCEKQTKKKKKVLWLVGGRGQRILVRVDRKAMVTRNNYCFEQSRKASQSSDGGRWMGYEGRKPQTPFQSTLKVINNGIKHYRGCAEVRFIQFL